MNSGNYYGGHAAINLWRPLTMDGDFSLAQIWVVAGQGKELNTVEAGWRVSLSTKYSPFWNDKRQLLCTIFWILNVGEKIDVIMKSNTNIM